MTPTRPDPGSGYTNPGSGYTAPDSITISPEDYAAIKAIGPRKDGAGRWLDADPLRPSEEQAARMWSGIRAGTEAEWFRHELRDYDMTTVHGRIDMAFALVQADIRADESFDRGRRSGIALGFLLGIALGAAVLLAWTWFR